MIGSLGVLIELGDQIFTPGPVDNTFGAINSELVQSVLDYAWKYEGTKNDSK